MFARNCPRCTIPRVISRNSTAWDLEVSGGQCNIQTSHQWHRNSSSTMACNTTFGTNDIAELISQAWHRTEHRCARCVKKGRRGQPHQHHQEVITHKFSWRQLLQSGYQYLDCFLPSLSTLHIASFICITSWSPHGCRLRGYQSIFTPPPTSFGVLIYNQSPSIAHLLACKYHCQSAVIAQDEGP